MNKLTAPSTSGSFNPRPREGATRGEYFKTVIQEQVSIRAPVRGRPVVDRNREPRALVSIRAPVRGRHLRDRYAAVHADVSIRAPVRGRPSMDSNSAGPVRFQSAPP